MQYFQRMLQAELNSLKESCTFKGKCAKNTEIFICNFLTGPLTIEDIDVQEPFFAIVNWPISEMYSVESATSAFLLQANWHLFSWLRGTEDFDSKYKILWGETRARGGTYS